MVKGDKKEEVVENDIFALFDEARAGEKDKSDENSDEIYFTQEAETGKKNDGKSEVETVSEEEFSTLENENEQPDLFSKENQIENEAEFVSDNRHWERLLSNVKAEKEEFELTQSYESARDKIQWSAFLILQLFGKVAYLTASQTNRFLEAWKTNIDDQIEFKPNILQTLISRNWIEKIEKPLEFRKGALKGKKLSPFYLTAKGYSYLKRIDPATARLARFGKPKPKMIERLRHEILISEVYIHLFEKGNYVIFIVPEEELRRERLELFWKQKIGFNAPKHSSQSIGDFRIFYFDKDENAVVSRDGEVAVRYTRDQILNKIGDLWWFCYDVTEAEKIEYITGQKATILTDRLFDVVKKREEKGIESPNKTDQTLNKWIEYLGGITIQTAAYLAKVHYNTATRNLRKRTDLTPKYTWLQPGKGNGRGIKLFFKELLLTDSSASHLSLVKNMTIQYLYEKGFDVLLENENIYGIDRKENKKYLLIFDADYYRVGDNWTDIIEEKRKIIEQSRKKNEDVIFAVGENGNAHVYRKRIENCKIISLSEHEFTFQNLGLSTNARKKT